MPRRRSVQSPRRHSCHNLLLPVVGPIERLRERQAEATRQQLVDVARQLFTERGYAGTSIEDIIERAGVARGALYHHFPGKGALFAAVYQVVQAEVASAVVAAALTADDPAQAVHVGLSAFLDACLEPEFRQIVGPGQRAGAPAPGLGG